MRKLDRVVAFLLLVFLLGVGVFPYVHMRRALLQAQSADGRTCAAVLDDRRIRIWDAETGEEIESFDAPFPMSSMSFGTCGRGECLCLWNKAGGSGPLLKLIHRNR